MASVSARVWVAPDGEAVAALPVGATLTDAAWLVDDDGTPRGTCGLTFACPEGLHPLEERRFRLVTGKAPKNAKAIGDAGGYTVIEVRPPVRVAADGFPVPGEG